MHVTLASGNHVLPNWIDAVQIIEARAVSKFDSMDSFKLIKAASSYCPNRSYRQSIFAISKDYKHFLRLVMSFSPTFGGFGDFVTAILIIRNLYSALSETSGSPREYQRLKDELDDVADVVQKLATRITTLNPEDAHSIQRQIEKWTVTLQLHEQRIRKYPALAEVTPGTALNKRQQIWRAIQKIKWNLVNSKDVIKMQDDINSFRLSFLLHLNVANL